MRSRPERPAAPDHAAPAVVAAHAASKGRYGSRKIKASLERSGVTVSRRRVCRIMRGNGLVSAYGRKRFRVHPGAVDEADVPNAVARGFDGRAPRTHICSDLTYVRVGASWNYACLLVDSCSREIVGHSAGPGKDARPVKSAFATLSFPISDIEVFHTDRGGEFDSAEIDLVLEAFGMERSLSAKGCPYDNAVDESTDGMLKAELVRREAFGTTRELRGRLTDYVHRCNNFRIHSTLGYMLPVEFKETGIFPRNRPNRSCQSTLSPRRSPAGALATPVCARDLPGLAALPAFLRHGRRPSCRPTFLFGRKSEAICVRLVRIQAKHRSQTARIFW